MTQNGWLEPEAVPEIWQLGASKGKTSKSTDAANNATRDAVKRELAKKFSALCGFKVVHRKIRANPPGENP